MTNEKSLNESYKLVGLTVIGAIAACKRIR